MLPWQRRGTYNISILQVQILDNVIAKIFTIINSYNLTIYLHRNQPLYGGQFRFRKVINNM